MPEHTPELTQPQLPFDEISYGYCHCGCGQKTNLAQQTRTRLGWVKGQPLRFIVGHQVNLRPVRSIAERFWEKIDKRGPDDCWDWIGARDPNGYGRLSVGSKVKETKRAVLTHRISYELHNGPIPDGLDICHRCDRPACNNPAHLFMGTTKDNLDDMISKGRQDFSGLPKGWHRKR